MTASRIIVDQKPVLRLNIHQFTEQDLPILDALGINQSDPEKEAVRYTCIHSQKDFLSTRTALLEHYEILEEKGPIVFLKAK